MKKTPFIQDYLDNEEQHIVQAIEQDDYIVGKSYLTAERLHELQAAARYTETPMTQAFYHQHSPAKQWEGTTQAVAYA